MKTKHLRMARLGLISFVGMRLSSAQKAFAQFQVVEDNLGRPYLAVPQGYFPPGTLCTRDNQYCYNQDLHKFTLKTPYVVANGIHPHWIQCPCVSPDNVSYKKLTPTPSVSTTAF